MQLTSTNGGTIDKDYSKDLFEVDKKKLIIFFNGVLK